MKQRNKPQTYFEAQQQLHDSFMEMLYLICKQVGVVWLAKKLPFLELRDWVKEKEYERN